MSASLQQQLESTIATRKVWEHQDMCRRKSLPTGSKPWTARLWCCLAVSAGQPAHKLLNKLPAGRRSYQHRGGLTHKAVLSDVQQGELLTVDMRDLQCTAQAWRQHRQQLSQAIMEIAKAGMSRSARPPPQRQQACSTHVTVVGGGGQILVLLASEDVNGNKVALGVAVLASLGS